MSLRFDLSGVAGNDLEFEFALTYNGIPLNLSGYMLAVYLKASATTPDALASVFGSGTGLTITDASVAQFTWAIPRADTALAAPGSLWYRVDVTDPDSNVATAMFGALNLAAA
jgi:hypothetical protein